MSKRFSLFAYLLLCCITLTAQIPQSPKREVRAVWLTTIGGLDWPHSYASSTTSAAKQQRELCQLLDKYQKAGINTVLMQARVRATTIYPSQFEPWDGCLSGHPGKSPGYDALRFAIDECHNRGMELHAWVVTMPVGKWDKLGARTLRQRHPGLIKKIGADGYMDPENPRTGDYLAEICGEIVQNYDVDGIHLDYIRYPEDWKGKTSRAQGRRHITDIVRKVSQRVKGIKPWIRMSCSPIGKFTDLRRYWSHGWNAYDRVSQDAQGWLRAGLMDQLYPMMYFRDNQFFPFAIDWAEQSHGKDVAPGLGIYFLNPREGNWKLTDITRQLHVMRQYGLGQAYFRGKFLTDNEQGIYDFVAAFNRHPALTPPIAGSSSAPQTPGTIAVQPEGLSWSGTTPYYNIYSSRTWPVDTDNPENLVATRRRHPSLAVRTEGRFFAVTGMDLYGNESPAIQSQAPPRPTTIAAPLLPCDGRHLTLPAKSGVLDARLLAVETLQGTVVATRNYHGATVDISAIAPGFYVLKSLGAKGVAHRLGFFEIKRK